jgi:hypothetical protein
VFAAQALLQRDVCSVAFDGAVGTVDTSKKTFVVHDGATAGSVPLGLESALTVKRGSLGWVDAVNGNDGTGQRVENFPVTTLVLPAATGPVDPVALRSRAGCPVIAEDSPRRFPRRSSATRNSQDREDKSDQAERIVKQIRRSM